MKTNEHSTRPLGALCRSFTRLEVFDVVESLALQGFDHSGVNSKPDVAADLIRFFGPGDLDTAVYGMSRTLLAISSKGGPVLSTALATYGVIAKSADTTNKANRRSMQT